LSEQNTEQAIRVRQVTDVHSNWSYQGDLENGKFSYQLILDNGAQEALIMPTYGRLIVDLADAQRPPATLAAISFMD
jgi:hypothetical protein